MRTSKTFIRPFHKHRWSKIKQWQLADKLFVIMRCRRCDQWIRKEISCNASNDSASLQIKTMKLNEQVSLNITTTGINGLNE